MGSLGGRRVRWSCTSVMFLACTLLHGVHGRLSLHDGQILQINRGVEVPFGRNVYLDPVTDLRINVQPGDRCMVTVLQNDPLSQRPGRLMPPTFDCNFRPNEVMYSHFGARNPAKDRVRLQIRYDSKSEARIIPFTIDVNVQFVQLEIITKNMPLTVPRLLAHSDSISSQLLQFTYNRATEDCKVSIISSAYSGLPRYGRIANESSVTIMRDCEEFLRAGIVYKHTAGSDSPDKDYLPCVVELMNKNGSLKKQEYFQMMVKILGGKPNARPSTSVGALLLMEVNQFVMTAITPEILAATDAETPAEKLIFNITGPLGFGEGVIVSTDDRNQPLNAFYQKDVQDLKIAYKPPSIDGDVRRIYQVGLQVVDAEGLASDAFVLMVIVLPMNTLAPVVTRNAGARMFEGQSRPLLSSKNLEISDEDNLKDVKVSVINGLRHGRLETGGRKFFTPADLDAGMVTYHHDDSDTYSDNIIFRMTDGRNGVEFLFPVTIFPRDDQRPIVNVNTGLQINKGQMVEINPYTLSATDIDSDDFSIQFVLEPPFSHVGQFFKRQVVLPPDPDNWIRTPTGLYEQPVSIFTQDDITNGKVFYRHVGKGSSQVIMDRIVFKVKDTSNNQSPFHTFIVKILPVDDDAPFLYPGIKLYVSVNEFQTTTIKKKVLRYTDNHSDDRRLTYTVTKALYDVDTSSPTPVGQLVLCDDDDRIVSTFTQAQVNHRKVCYKPPTTELGIAPRLIRFDFLVTDPSNNSITDQQFTLLLNPINNKPPIVINTGFEIFENGFRAISTDMLDATDPDTDDNLLNFTMLELPKHGEIHLLANKIKVGRVFHRLDISEGRLGYRHLGLNELTKDSFKLDVSDGVHHVPVDVKIRIQSIDDEAPRMSLPVGTLGSYIEVLEGQSTVITSKVLSATDPDTDALKLTFILEKPPTEGILTLDGRITDRFSQRDIRNNLVRYKHTGGEIGLERKADSFNLSLSDMSDQWLVGGNKISDVAVFVTIVPVDNSAPTMKIVGVLTVNEGNKSTITLNNIAGTDRDTPVDDIICTIVAQPTHGYVENTSPAPGSEKPRVGIPISAFSLKDIRLASINYVQSIHDSREPKEDRFTFQCSDGVNFSPRMFFDIRVIQQNDEKPEMFTRDFVVMEGHNLIIDTPILNAIDRDTPPSQLQFTILVPPKHGKVLRQGSDISLKGFGLSEITGSSTIMYEHDDSETTFDEIKLELTDGNFVVDRLIPITVIPVDDETPRLSINNGLDVDIGETKCITNKDLKAEDLDSEDKNITYVVKKVARHGFLQRIVNGSPRNISLGLNFSQWEVDRGNRICYVHFGQGGVRDLIKFDVTDGHNPLIDRYFYVSVEGIDMTYPEVVNKGVELPEGGRVILSTSLLSTTDLNSPDEKLTYTVTRAPSRGHLELANNPGVPITTFKQIQVAGNQVVYIHTSEEEIKMDSFEFEVTDGYNPVFRTFRISLSDVDNKKPVLMIDTLRLKEGATKIITPFELKAVDRDTADKKVVFTITRVPLHGTILHNTTKKVTRFTMYDLNHNLISYSHDGTETATDTFSFMVTDGTHADFYVFPDTGTTTRRSQTFDIAILAVDNSVPQIMVNSGVGTLHPISTGPASGTLGFQFSGNVIRAEDRDSAKSDLMYIITSPPKHGVMVDTKFGNTSTLNWTQGAVDQMRVYYLLKPNVNATSDVFYFKIKDQGGNELTDQPFYLNWAWISLETRAYTVGETQTSLLVKLKRRGYLGETSFVSVRAKNGTAKSGEDFRKRYAHQVQFNPGQVEKSWRLRLLDDSKYELAEQLTLEIYQPVMAILEQPSVAIVTIEDPEDESRVSFDRGQYFIAEDIGQLSVRVRRSGDLSDELMVICSTVSGTASGTTSPTVSSGSDYITRNEDHRSIVRFDRGETEKFCKVRVIDDSLYEVEESFTLRLSLPMGGALGHVNTTKVFIKPHKEDEPAIYLGSDRYTVDESDNTLDVKVWRTGTDLTKPSSITVRSRKTKTGSAQAGLDYIAVNQAMDFAPGEMMKTVLISVLDDLGRPQLEGPETFELVLRMPTGAARGEPSKAIITINDSLTDLPKMYFKEPLYHTFENDGSVTAVIVRTGDITQISTVRCYTRQDSAQVMMDYDERPNTDASTITFLPGEREKSCRVILMGDREFEEEEQFRLVLGTPSSPTLGTALIGKQNVTIIKVKDSGDKSVIKFGDVKFSVDEPKDPGGVAVVEVPVVRVGDLSQTSLVRVYTKDGSAKSGLDYNGFSRELEFGFNISRHVIKLEVLYDGEKEMRESFTVLLRPDRNMVSEIRDKKALVYIEEMDKMADVTFPSPPLAVSLKYYDDAENAQEPVPGYPAVCITSCNPKHPDYSKTGTICKREGINDTLTVFRWRVSAPSYVDGVTSRLQDVESSTFFTDPHRITLDSIYFGAGSRVQCAARAVNLQGDAGLELLSSIVTMSRTKGICMPRVLGSVGAEPFTAKLRYTGPGDPDHPNMIRLAVSIPHRDGMLPVISTRQLSNFELTLSPDGTRLAQHKCSNLLDVSEKATRYSFITNATRNPNTVGETEPYQYSSKMRGEKALRFYRNLDIESCLWEFVSYFDMSEVISECGGSIGTDGQVKNLKQSYVSVRVPFFVSYIFHSPVATGGWQHFDLNSKLRLTFVYDTAILWQNGVSAEDAATSLQGYLYPTGMRIREDGRLVVNFRTEARFRGLFVISHPGSSLQSIVVPPEHIRDISFTLELLRSEPTFAQPEQMWEFVSDYAVRDYSGQFRVKLIPCVTSLNQDYALPVICNPRAPMIFDLDIRFQQISDPVPTEFSLNTQFHLLRKKALWLSDGSMGFGSESDAAFGPGDTIYGRVMIDPVQNLGDGFNVNIEKTFICTGKDGYIPKYEPSSGEFGCLAQSANLLHAFKIIDKGAPNTVKRAYREIPFNARLAIDDSSAVALVRQSGADGFSISAKPLFQVDTGRQWFAHTIYTVRSRKNSQRGIGKRSIAQHHIATFERGSTRNRRAVEDTAQIGRSKGRGTNMAAISLNFNASQTPGTEDPAHRDGTYVIDSVSKEGSPPDSSNIPVIPLIVGVLVFLLILTAVVVAVLLVRRRRKKQSEKIKTVQAGRGNSRVVQAKYDTSNSSEV